jgi:heme exporter protein B
MSKEALRQFSLLFKQGLAIEFQEKERLLTPLLFATLMLLLFNFVLDEQAASLQVKLFIAEVFLAMLFALHLSFSRIFEADQQDRAFDLLPTYPVNALTWFAAKYFLALLFGGFIVAPTILVTGLFHGQTTASLLLSPVLWAVAVLALAGLSALGVLLSAMTMKARGREVLFPLLYFPLAIPVLIAASEAVLSFVEASSGSNGWQWLALLSGFDVIFITLSGLLFAELVGVEQ